MLMTNVINQGRKKIDPKKTWIKKEHQYIAF
jgi:hypothetical protein